MEEAPFYMKLSPTDASVGQSIAFSSNATTSGSTSCIYTGYPYRVDIGFDENGVWEVYRQDANVSNNWGMLPPKVFKNIYEIVDGKLVHTKTVEGKQIPELIIPETYSFEDDSA